MSQRRTVGAIVKVPLGDGFHTYARTLGEASFAIYDYKTKDDIEDLNVIISKPVLFIVAVYNDAITRGRWKNVGKVPLEKKFEKLPLKFIQDVIDPTKFRIYDNGIMKSATREQCMGLECAAVWEAEEVEERINDYYAGRKNKSLEQMSIK